MLYHLDLHVHSDASPDGRHGLDALARAAARKGLNGLAVADHNRFTLTEPETRHGVLLLPACEFSTQEGFHLLALFCREPVPIPATSAPLAFLSAEIRRRGGLAVLAHPYAGSSGPPEDLASVLDGVETANARACFHRRDANRLAEDYGARHRLFFTGGSDAHSWKEVGGCYTQVDADGPEALRDALAAGAGSPVLVQLTPRRYKGLSQWKKALRQRSFPRLLRAGLYVGYCFALDLWKPQGRNERSE